MWGEARAWPADRGESLAYVSPAELIRNSFKGRFCSRAAELLSSEEESGSAYTTLYRTPMHRAAQSFNYSEHSVLHDTAQSIGLMIKVIRALSIRAF